MAPADGRGIGSGSLPEEARDPNEVLTDEDHGQQKLLGLTSVSFHMRHESHPDRNPWPWWCGACADDAGHLIDPVMPFKARHPSVQPRTWLWDSSLAKQTTRTT